MRQAYDSAFHPTAPVLLVVVRGPNGKKMSVRAKIDTAADVSGLPQAIVEQLGLIPARRVRASTWRGEPANVRLYRGDLSVAGRRFDDVEWLPLARPYALLGRDVINQLSLLLDGPELALEIRPESRRRRPRPGS